MKGVWKSELTMATWNVRRIGSRKWKLRLRWMDYVVADLTVMEIILRCAIPVVCLNYNVR